MNAIIIYIYSCIRTVVLTSTYIYNIRLVNYNKIQNTFMLTYLRKEAIIMSYSSCSLTIKISFKMLLILLCFDCYLLFCFTVFCMFLFCIFFHIWKIATLAVYDLRLCLAPQCLRTHTKITKLHDNNVFFFFFFFFFYIYI